METLYIFDCGCKITEEKTKIKTKNLTGEKYKCSRVCLEHEDAELLYKIVKCKCGLEIKTNKKCNIKKCPECGYVIKIRVSDNKKPTNKKKKKVVSQRAHDCLFCDQPANKNNKDNLCTACHHKDIADQFMLELYDGIFRKSLVSV